MLVKRSHVWICLVVLCLAGVAPGANTDWFKDAGYGVFMHFLPGDAKGLALVNEFNVQALAGQLETLGAKYFVLTLGQNSGFFNAPNATYDRLTGYAPGERCSTRDLPLDLYQALKSRGIRLMLYLPCQTPNADARAQKAFGLPQGKKDQPIDLEFAQKWAQVIQEWSDRYGDKVAGWWFDGGYDHIKFNEAIAQVYAKAVKHGNPNAIVTFNPGVKLIRHTQAEDYTAGELNEPFDVLPASRWVEGSQWHALTFLGAHWSARDTRFPTENWVQWVSTVVSKGGVVTLDMGPNWNPQAGPISALAEAQMAQVQAIHAALDRANPSRPAVELRARDGLPNFFARAKAGEKLTVAYFGGSITAANGWRPQTTAWLRQHYPQANFTEIDAAIGGTGSDLGVFRLGHDVLDYHPDLVFVEFAVNDSGAPPEQIYRCMEGIVRQIRHANPATDICFVYTMHDGMLRDLAAGRLPRSASAMELIADHYGIPSIHLAQEAARRVNAGEWVFTAPKPEVPADPAKGLPARPAFAGDSCHPFAETGHKLYTEAIARSFKAMEGLVRSVPARASKETPRGVTMNTPFAPDNHENAKLIPLTAAMLGDGWQSLDLKTDPIAKGFARRLPVLWRADKPGATLTFAFHGRSAAIYDLLGPDGGELEVVVDNRPAKMVRRFDAYCTYHRLGTTALLSDTQVGDHTVTIRLTGNTFDKAEILSHNKNKIDDPARFAPLRWYAGALLIDGDLKQTQTATMPKRLKRSESFLGIHFDFHAGPDCNEIGKNTTRAMIENVINQVHPDYIQIDCKGHPGLSSYPTKVGNQAPGFVGDPLRLWRQVTAEHGVALYMHYSGVWDAEAVRRHPDWAVVNADGKTSDKATSFFGPYADKLLIPQLRELAGDYGVDGAWVDGDCWASVPDYGEAALKAFRQATGTENVPRKPGDPHWFEFLQFHREAFRQYLRHNIAEVKRTNPDFQYCSNWAFTDHMPEPVTAPVDFLSGDYAPDDSVNSARLSGRYLTRQGVPWDLMAWSFSRGKSKDGRNQKTAVQLEREAAVVLALGGGFQAYFTQKRDGSIREERVPVMAEVAKFCRQRQAICHHATQVPQVAVLFSTAAHYRKSNGLFARDLARINGALQALLEGQQSVEIQGEHHLTGRMAEYPLIVVPEWEYLEPKFKDDLVAYVKGGGNLLLIGPKTAALFQAELGVTLDGEPTPAGDYRLAHNGGLAPLTGQRQAVKLGPNSRPFGELRGSSPSSQPAASISSLGQGKIAALYFTFGQGYVNDRNDVSRRFLNDLARGLFPKPMVEVKGSSDVDVVVNRLGGRLAVNLVNTAGPHQKEPILDSIPPVGPLDITIRTPKEPAKVTLEPGGQSLPFQYRDGETRLTLPRLEIHSIIVVD
ncbi:MAG: alpha-L-fucosidase [Phycisphaerae bacterium]|nr:alpha-L-fucosidase [Phycisphaerae bacterium]